MLEIIIIIILMFLNGLLAMSEIAFVSSKRYKLEQKAEKGNRSAKTALLLLEEPDKFLSAIQIGITLIGIVAGAFGGYAMAEDLEPYIKKIYYLQEYSAEIAFTLIVAFITYLSLVIGELAPKSIAINYPEKITIIMAPAMFLIRKIFTPIVVILSYSTKFLLFILRVKKNEEPPVTEEELKSLLEKGTIYGTIEKKESEIIKKVFSFNDKKVLSIMIPRKEIRWIDAAMSNMEIFDFISANHHSRYLLCDNSIDSPIGLINAKEFLINYKNNPNLDIKKIKKDLLVVPDFVYSMSLLEKFRKKKTKVALIVDEYGGTQGIVTLHDLIEDILGELPEHYEQEKLQIIRRNDGSYLADGLINIRDLSDILSIELQSSDFSTLSGFVMNHLGRIPTEGDIIEFESYLFEVIDMDGKRIDKILISQKELE